MSITASSHALRILLAEDIELNQRLTQKLLGRTGHSIEIVSNGREAVEAVMRSDYDVVLMDIKMPEMDGIEATRRIRALPAPKSQVWIIALTAQTGEDQRLARIDAGMDDYVSKPINFDILFTKLTQVAERLGQSAKD
jgi:CheY-like chemotaxis protein